MAKNKNTIKITTLIGQNAVCNGDFRCPGSARIDGTINGSVEVEGILILGTSGIINGDVYAKAVSIGGEVIGNINAPEKAQLAETSRVIGDIVTDTIVIDEHAIFQGNVTMNQDTGNRAKTSAYRRGVRSDRKLANAVVDDALSDISLGENEIEEV